MARAFAACIRAYQLLLRPAFPPSCRFAPTCSEYARAALLTHGARRGLVLAVRRLGRCHAWHPGGYDPVPEPRG
jgi:putative membrane protein insertion efficiency factor